MPIADSANFNGIKLLDGSLDETVRQTTETVFRNLTASHDLNKGNTTGTPATDGGLDLVGVAGMADKGIQYHKDANRLPSGGCRGPPRCHRCRWRTG